jgi:hypothetical protein
MMEQEAEATAALEESDEAGDSAVDLGDARKHIDPICPP